MADAEELDMAIHTMEQAELYANNVTLITTPVVKQIYKTQIKRLLIAPHPYGTKDFRHFAWYSGITDDGPVEQTMVVMLEATQRFADPEYIRDAIEMNPNKVIYGNKYFMWEPNRYRNDSFYAPSRTPIAVPALGGATWRDPVDTYPLFAYTGGIPWATVDIDLLDYRYINPENRIDESPARLAPYRVPA